MNKRQKEVQQQFLDNEKAVLKKLEQAYKDALDEINSKIEILLSRQDADMQHVIYQVEYQKALKTQVQAILETLQTNEFETLSDYLTQSYEDGFIGTLYDLQGQGVPLIFPIDQAQVAAAIRHETKLSESLYTSLGKDIKDLQKKIAGEISRGISGSMMYTEIARNIAGVAGIPKNRAMTIARTEAHRIQVKATSDAQFKAKEKGADVVKQWDSTLDKKTRRSHKELDGQIRELEEPFEVNGKKAMMPGGFNRPEEDINCRCALLQRARWNLDIEETQYLGRMDGLSDEELQQIADKLHISVKELRKYQGQIIPVKAKSYGDFKRQYNRIWHYEGSGLQKEAEARITGYKKKSSKHEQATEQLTDQLKILFPDDVYKIKGFTEDVKKEVDIAMKKLNNEYEIKLNSIVVEPAEKRDIFVIGYHDGVVDMVVNENADFEKIMKVIRKRYESGLFAGKSLEDYIAHEMAHCMLYQDCKTDAEYYARYEQIESLYSNLKGISGYADKTQSGNEALAEAFVRTRNNEKVAPIVKVLVNTYFGKWKK